MTFKHVKFEDSAVMRSLEKVATQKGLVKSDPLKKTASKQLDLFPTINLTENILKLCEGLRQQGFNKYADELEDKFVVYKQAAAATLYETTSEKGEDLVDAAHPKGSHHLEGLDSDEAVIETILDQHLKDTKMVEKTPTGKLSDATSILRAVKVALGEEENLDLLYKSVSDNFVKFRNLYAALARKVGEDSNYNDMYLNILQSQINKKNVYANQDFETVLTRLLDDFKEEFGPGFFSSGTERLTWQNEVSPMIEIGHRFANAHKDIVAKIRKIETDAKVSGVKQQFDPDAKPAAPAAAPVANPVLEKINTAKQQLAGIVGLVNASRRGADPAEIKEIDAWIKDTTEDLADLEKSYTRMSPQDAEAALGKITVDFARVRQEWA